MLSKLIKRFLDLMLLGRTTPLKSVREIIGWWEVQRITFNFVVGITGLLSDLENNENI